MQKYSTRIKGTIKGQIRDTPALKEWLNKFSKKKENRNMKVWEFMNVRTSKRVKTGV